MRDLWRRKGNPPAWKPEVYSLERDWDHGIVSFPENAEAVSFRELPEGISGVQVVNGITAIPDSVFWGCETLVEVALPQTIRTIGKGAFDQYVNLMLINIPEGVTSIGDVAFLMCSSLTRLTIPDSVTSIEGNPFRSMSVKIQVFSENPAISVVNGIVFNKERTLLIAWPSNQTGAYEIPQGVLDVLEIGTHAFENCNDLTDVTISNRERHLFFSSCQRIFYNAILYSSVSNQFTILFSFRLQRLRFF